MSQNPVRCRRPAFALRASARKSLVPATILVAGFVTMCAAVYATGAIRHLSVRRRPEGDAGARHQDVGHRGQGGPWSEHHRERAALRLAAQSHGARRQRPAHQRGARALPLGTEEVLRGPASGHPGVAHRHGAQPALAVPRDEGPAGDRERRQPHHDRRGAGALQRCARRVCRAPGRGVPESRDGAPPALPAGAGVDRHDGPGRERCPARCQREDDHLAAETPCLDHHDHDGVGPGGGRVGRTSGDREQRRPERANREDDPGVYGRALCANHRVGHERAELDDPARHGRRDRAALYQADDAVPDCVRAPRGCQRPDEELLPAP